MAHESAQPQQESTRTHDDEAETAARKGPVSVESSIPAPEDGSHSRSHAAHLGHVHEQTKPADKLRQGMASNTLREPPVVVSRVGKQNRG
jgi:hypothetical protein